MDPPAKSPPPADAGTEAPASVVEPPAVYVAACGVLCDIFWWARRPGPSAPNS
jgi:hypothetical protein